MAVIVVTERIRGTAVCTTTQRRTQLMNAAANWVRRGDALDMPQADAVPAGKYGAGPTAVLAVDFPDRASADAAWADIDAFNPTFLLDGSSVQQHTAREDGVSVNETTVHHRVVWRNGQRIVEV